MELIIFGLILFIVGVAGTMVYDKMKVDGKSLTDYLPRVNQQDEELEAFTKQVKKTTSRNHLDKILAEAKMRQSVGQSTVTVKQGGSQQTMSVNDLIKQIEEMKKRL